jgi:hypothetical protein
MISTKVGLASDLLNEKCLYENQELGMTNLNWNLVEERLYEWRKKSFSLINKL